MMLLILALLVYTGASEPVDERPTLLGHIRTETTQPLDARFLREVTDIVRNIWRPYVDLAFGTDGARLPVLPVDTLHLVITDRVAAGTGDAEGLGWIEFVDGRPSPTITASIAAARHLLAHGSWQGKPIVQLPRSIGAMFLIRALAGTIAHEIGHFLLQSRTHSRTGLMRERFVVREIMEMRNAHYQLEPADERRLERRLLEYAQAAPVRPGRTPPS